MSKYKPLYRYTLTNAHEFDEVEQWRESLPVFASREFWEGYIEERR